MVITDNLLKGVQKIYHLNTKSSTENSTNGKLNILQILQETPALESLFNKPATLKRDFNTVVFV